ncbi:MAG: M23 family metallopeptidase [Candidatus Uhrbacteria bacterium]
MSNPSPIQLFMSRIALAGLRALGGIKNLLVKISKPFAPAARTIGSILVRRIILPSYRIVLILRLRLGYVVLSARGMIFLIFTHRYILHGVVAALCLVTIATQLQAHEASALDSGQRSLLYSLLTNDQDIIVEEDASPDLVQKDAHYLGQDTIVGDPGVDYDYTNPNDIPADLTVPGSIALLPGAEEPGAPGDVRVDRTKTETYTIQAGDTISVIASRFGVTVGTVLWANDLNAKSLIKPGTTLKIPPVSGILHTITKGDTLKKISTTYDADLNEILAFNHIEGGTKLTPGEELVIPGGTPPAIVARPLAIVKNRATNLRPDVPISRIRGKALDVYQEITGKNDARTKPADAPETVIENVAKGKFLWPTRLHVINQYYGWQHTGLDIDGDYTDPLYAAEDGVVEKAGWNSGGYGLMVLINHGNGNKTRYGHASKLFVKEGDTVKRGETIAMMGTTGRSTGTHLHFEVYINNKRVNPLAYIK